MRPPITFRTIDTIGEKSAIITGAIDQSELTALARKLILKDPTLLEQAGVIDTTQEVPTFTMMGNELSINGTFAAAYVILSQLKKAATPIYLVGPNLLVSARMSRSKLQLAFPRSLIVTQLKNNVKLAGMNCYIPNSPPPSSPKVTKEQKLQLSELTRSYPAGGVIYNIGSTIYPLIYVKSTDTYVWEQACGSGSLSFALSQKIAVVCQPSGQKINFIFSKNTIKIAIARYDCKEV